MSLVGASSSSFSQQGRSSIMIGRRDDEDSEFWRGIHQIRIISTWHNSHIRTSTLSKAQNCISLIITERWIQEYFFGKSCTIGRALHVLRTVSPPVYPCPVSSSYITYLTYPWISKGRHDIPQLFYPCHFGKSRRFFLPPRSPVWENMCVVWIHLRVACFFRRHTCWCWREVFFNFLRQKGGEMGVGGRRDREEKGEGK